MTKIRQLGLALAAFGLAAGMALPAAAQDKLKLAIGQRGNWDTSVSEVGTRLGIFKKHGLELEMLYTQGGGETQQAVLSNSVDIGVAVGIMGALGAYSKGAPIRIIGAETTGGQDLFWYVKADSPIKTLKDFEGKTVAYSTNGSSTHGVVNAYIKENNIKPRPTATGGPAATLTQVMSGQIDVGWSAPPFGLQQLDKGEIRVIATGNDTQAFKSQTVRLLVTNTATMQAKKPVLERFMKAYRETVDAMYSDPAALKHYADFVGIPEAIAKRTRDEFFPKTAIDPDKIVGLETIVPDAVTLKYTAQPLTKEQLSELIQIPPR
ncbi:MULTISPECIES: ABC transporter substrate-binding protein [Bosea]|jgi:NitT/TauT family transport system substrate-binding protein|uniref:ABC transporter substrate-binding protein n=1 Tax=Bosea rubneri TaxID=3075434 RepID=A0ABU3S889_9HYPH|nr:MULTISPECIES: ABC transporter substrate-binding protein [unclassified Bosea (in: a-proteobacteria)]MDU0341000.1 ABC transporter substrate-binding protein [Bosea sp. ZW T0_25]HEV7335273.1 ABC transporter substrate-binding protein [Bosea sp. (in: a-proteobacteria)]